MQAPPIKLHWFPMDPSWMVAIVVIVFAALPHQLSIPVSFGLRTHLGRILFAASAIAIGWKKPVLGMALIILLVSTNISEYVEGFSQNITRDNVNKKGRWYSEEVMNEEPSTIQERTDGIIIRDDITDQDAKPWFGESSLGETPQGIQERTTPMQPVQETNESHGMHR